VHEDVHRYAFRPCHLRARHLALIRRLRFRPERDTKSRRRRRLIATAAPIGDPPQYPAVWT